MQRNSECRTFGRTFVPFSCLFKCFAPLFKLPVFFLVGHLTFQCRNTILLKDPVLPASSSKSPLTNEMDEARNDRRSVSKVGILDIFCGFPTAIFVVYPTASFVLYPAAIFVLYPTASFILYPTASFILYPTY